MQIYAVNAIIFDQFGRVLLTLRQDMPFWNIPGGGIEDGEDAKDAVLREISEELAGLAVTFSHKLGRYISTTDNHTKIVDSFIFSCEYQEGMQIILAEEEEEILWRFFDKEDLPKNIFPPHRTRIADALTGEKDIYKELSSMSLVQAAQELALDDFVEIDYWLSHPSVLKNKENGTLKYWPLKEE